MGRCKGSLHSLEVRQKISAAMRGHLVSEETRQKISRGLYKGGRKPRSRTESQRLKRKWAKYGGELEFLIAEQAKDDRMYIIKNNPSYDDASVRQGGRPRNEMPD